MKILVIGGTGTIGKKVAGLLKPNHELVIAGSKSGDIQVDITNRDSISKMFKSLGKLDAVVITTGSVHFAPLAKMDTAAFQIGLNSKLMGQVNVVLEGISYLRDGGSFTLTSGILNHDPIVAGSSAAMVNGAIDGFVTGAAIELERGLRINVVSPTMLTESEPTYGPFFAGFKSVPALDVAKAFVKSVEGKQTGQIYRVGYNL